MNSPNFLRTRFLSRNNSIEALGVFASTVRAIHCAVTPLIIGALPLLGLEVFANKRTEWLLVTMSVVLGICSQVPSDLRRHGRSWPLILFMIGVRLILSARLGFGEALRAEIPFVVISALLVAASHLLNCKLCRTCPVCPDDCT